MLENMPGIVLRGGSVVLVLASLVAAQESRPTIVYGTPRTSTGYVETPNGRVAIDRGVTWQGVTVFLSLTWDLVAVDGLSGKTLWNRSVGAFWNEVGFVELESSPGVKAWFVELRPGPGARDGADRRQHHDLRTGKIREVSDPLPSGRQVSVGDAHGGECAFKEPFRRVVASDADWNAVLLAMFPGSRPAKVPAVDFAKQLVVVIAAGKAVNIRGISIVSAWEDESRLLLRVDETSFQTSGPGGGGQDATPWGVFVVPRRDPFKTVVVERDAQSLIGGPPMWKEICRFTAPGDPVGSMRRDR